MSILETIIIAIVEGLTEFLPISSTGHMMLTQAVLGVESTAFVRAFTVMIQFGAILSVLVYYWRRFLPMPIAGIKPDERTDGLSGFNLYLLMLIGCLPAAVLGLLLDDYIDALLGNIWLVVVTLFVGGVAMIVLDKRLEPKGEGRVTPVKALMIGFFQCIAMIPGVSRSMATIFGGMQQGLTRRGAAEFSFFLAIPTMLGATLLKGYKLYKEFGWAIYQEHWQELLVGNVVAFVVALLAIKYFIGFVSKYGFRAFGYYRIVLAMVFALLLLSGVPLQID